MKLMADIQIAAPAEKISYNDSIFLIGSCFTEHIGNRLADLKFPVQQNPNGILFDPISVCRSLQSYILPRLYTTADLFYHNELWQSWHHHSSFSGMEAQDVLEKINQSQMAAHAALQKATWMMITLGSAFTYHLTEEEKAVANCHRAPGQWFSKQLTSVEEIAELLTKTIKELHAFNPTLKVIFTISPVRHLRDGLVENSRSKARLIEAVHQLTDCNQQCMYFPAYELVIDVLRDYRFYDIDLAHPNYAATEYVFSRFTENYFATPTLQLMDEVKQLVTAAKHKPFQPGTAAHKRFLASMVDKTKNIQQRLPHLNFRKELEHFSGVATE